MKVAILLVSSACLVGAGQQPGGPTGGNGGGEKPKDKVVVVQPGPGPGPGAVTTYGGDCGGGCGCDTGCGGGGFLQRCKDFCGGLFNRGHGCGCAPAPTCNTGCNTGGCGNLGGGHNLFHHDSCGCGSGGGFLQRCRDFCGGLFHRNDCCDTCNTGCNSCGNGGYAGGNVIIKGGETIPPPKDGPPKEMPKGPGGEPPSKQVQILNPGQPTPVQTPNLEAPPAAQPLIPANPIQERPF